MDGGLRLISSGRTMRPSRWVAYPALVFMAGGMFGHVAFSGGFLTTPGDEVNWAVFILSVPVVPVMLRGLSRDGGNASTKHPPAWGRWIFLYPAAVLLLSFCMALAPSGWMTTWSFVSGTPSGPFDAVVDAVPSGPGRGCDKRVWLTFDQFSGRVCLDNRLKGRVPKVREHVVIFGRMSRHGLHVSQVVLQD